jgi:hypothetical protein
VVPLVPHVRTDATTKVGPTQYTVAAYVTYYNNDLTTNELRVTVVASWTNVERKGLLNYVQTQSLFASPGGCLSTQTHPFAAPCQPFLYGTSIGDQGSITVSGTIQGINLTDASIQLPGFGSSLQVEQISAVQGQAQTSGVTLSLQSQTEQVLGSQIVTSASDTDPAQPKPAWETNSAAPQSTQTLSAGGGANSLTATLSAGDTAATTSTVSATTSPSYPCPNITGLTNMNNALPCGAATAQLLGNAGLQLGLQVLGIDLGTSTLASVAPLSCGLSTCPNRGVNYRLIAPTTGMCPATTTDGCIHTDGARSFGAIQLGGLPSGIAGPLGWQGYLVRLNSWQDTATAESGIGSAAPAVVAPVAGTGTISFWNGLGYTTCTVYASNCPPSGGNYPVTPVSLNIPVLLQTLTVTLQASIKVGGKSTTQTPTTCSGTCTRTRATATSGSPLIGDVKLKASLGGNVLIDLTIHVDMGNLTANTTYQAAPSGA